MSGMSGSVEPLFKLPEARESTPVKGILRGNYAQDTEPQGLQLLQASASIIPPYEDHGVAGPCPPTPSGEVVHSPVAVCTSALRRS